MHANRANMLIGILQNTKVLGNILFNTFFKIYDIKISLVSLHGVWGLEMFDVS